MAGFPMLKDAGLPPTLLYVFNKELTVHSLFFWALETKEDQSNQF